MFDLPSVCWSSARNSMHTVQHALQQSPRGLFRN